jgi:serine/threonine protein kinase
MTNLLALPGGTELVGDYKIKRVLGAGGFGITYLADEIALAREVTIKEYFPSDFAARDGDKDASPRSRDSAADYKWGLDRFIEEAQTLARFDHPNIVRVYRYFRAHNTGYMVLKFEEGQSLRGWLKGLKRAPRQTELDQIVAPLLDALEFIHKGDFLHRDIAPDNVMIRADRTPVLIDFGSARGEIVAHSRAVSALVKPGYSPYEQYATTTRQQGPWTDIYALGATLYQAISGKRPPDAPSRMVNDEYVSARDVALGSYRPGFLTAIDTALRLEIGERPQSIAAWRGSLLAPDEKPQRVAKVGAAAAGFGQSLAEGLGLKKPSPASADGAPLVAKANPAAQAPPPPDAPQPPGQLLDFIDNLKKPSATAATPKAKAKNITPVATVTPAPSKSDTPGVGLGYGPAPEVAARATPITTPEAEELIPVTKVRTPKKARVQLPAVIAQAPPEPVKRTPPRLKRRWFWLRAPWRGLIFKSTIAACAASFLVAYQDRVPRWRAPVSTTASSDVSASSIASSRKQPPTFVPTANAPTATATATSLQQPTSIQLVGHKGPVLSAAFAQQGRRIVSAGTDGTLKIWDAASGQLVRTVIMPDGPPAAMATRDGQALTGHASGQLVLWDLESGDRLASYKRNDVALTAVAFTDEPERFATASRDGKLTVWDRKTSTAPSGVADASDGVIQSIAYMPRGNMLAAPAADYAVKVWSAETLTLVRTYRGHAAAISALDRSPDGRTLVSGSEDGNIRLWSTGSTRMIKSLRAHTGRVTALAHGLASDTLASAGEDGTVRIWDTKRGKTVASFQARSGPLRALGFSTDSRRLATAGDDGILRVWTVADLYPARD